MVLQEYFVSAAASLGVELTQESIEKFLVYLDELDKWNKTTNLTTLGEPKEVLVKHFLDSLVGSRFISHEPQAHILDVGSGAGFPGIPIRLLRNDLSLILLEPNKKKVSFLRYILGYLRLTGVTVLPQDIEAYCYEQKSSDTTINWIVTRALNVDELLPHFRSILKKNAGRLLLYRSKPFNGCLGTSFRVDREFFYELPDNFGTRVLSILQCE